MQNYFINNESTCNWSSILYVQLPLLVGRAVTRSSLEREVWSSNLGPVKLDTVLPTACHRCDISSKGAVLPRRNDAKMGPANSLHVSAYYSKYNERFDLIGLANSNQLYAKYTGRSKYDTSTATARLHDHMIRFKCVIFLKKLTVTLSSLQSSIFWMQTKVILSRWMVTAFLAVII